MDASEQADGIEWVPTLRLGAVASVLAALAAIALGRHLPEPTIVVGIIVLATMASWFQLEQPPAPRPARLRRHRQR